MTLSVAAVIPLYNGERYIAAAVESVLAQTVMPDEIVVVDDGSTDSGPAIVERFADRGVKMVRRENGGQGAARNTGVASTSSEVICFLDQDDLWYTHHVEVLAKTFKKATKSESDRPLGWAYANLDEIDEDGAFVSENLLHQLGGTHPKSALVECLGEDMFVLPGACMVSREAFDAVDGFDERFRGYEDDDLFLRIFRKGYRNVFVDEAVAQWRIYGSSTSYSPTMAASRVRYFRKLVAEFAADDSLGRYYVQDTIAPRFLWKAGGAYRQAMRREDAAGMKAAVAEMREVSAHLSRARRLRVRVLIPLLGTPGVARAADLFDVESRVERFWG